MFTFTVYLPLLEPVFVVLLAVELGSFMSTVGSDEMCGHLMKKKNYGLTRKMKTGKKLLH